jgi:hypothetical protein
METTIFLISRGMGMVYISALRVAGENPSPILYSLRAIYVCGGDSLQGRIIAPVVKE